jgi:hypothetical protein
MSGTEGRGVFTRLTYTPSSRPEPAQRIDGSAVLAQLEIQVRSSDRPAVSDDGDLLPSPHLFPLLDQQGGGVGVDAQPASAVVDDRSQAISTEPLAEDDGAVRTFGRRTRKGASMSILWASFVQISGSSWCRTAR